jgi:hypothetical protein
LEFFEVKNAANGKSMCVNIHCRMLLNKFFKSPERCLLNMYVFQVCREEHINGQAIGEPRSRIWNEAQEIVFFRDGETP